MTVAEPQTSSADNRTALLQKKKLQQHQNPTWGRQHAPDFVSVATCAMIMAFCPFMVVYFWMACDSYQCSLSEPLTLLYKLGFTESAFRSVIVDKLPAIDWNGMKLYAAWLGFQGLLHAFLPGKLAYGQNTPAGHLLQYNVNGLQAWMLTHALFIAGSFYFKLFSPTIIYDYWGTLLVATNVYGYFLSAFVYVKAHLFPTHAGDRKFSGSLIYDFFFGIEFNPRFGKLWDFKLFHNGRIGIVAWTLINLSFAAAQYQQIGYVTNSMVLVNWLHFLYVIDFFINEEWYLKTVDICHDHMGFYLAWGDACWLPFMYTLQSHYLVRNPVDLHPLVCAAVFGVGMFGYYIFRAVNHQKDFVRKHDGNCLIWGKPAKFVRAKYTTTDGKEHSSILLASGWWGLARHFNYTGDLILSFAMCAACGFQHLLPYFYIIYMTILLLTRIRRDDARCSGKYGKYWEDYKKLVRWQLIPYVY
ncbi:hypothetical protein MIR68_008008 [Amoeboaphelidium protococcarum]|nr:hypothetical protein MIR68_008008 [Amoeboaphelidium protococcarum]